MTSARQGRGGARRAPRQCRARRQSGRTPPAARARSAARSCRRRHPPRPGPRTTTREYRRPRCSLFLLYLLNRRPLSTRCTEVMSWAGFTSGHHATAAVHTVALTSLTFNIKFTTYRLARPRFLMSVVKSVATLAHRAMQRGPCKSRVTVTSAHAVLVPLQWRLNIYLYLDLLLGTRYIALLLGTLTKQFKLYTAMYYCWSDFYARQDLFVMPSWRDTFVDVYNITNTNSWPST